MDKILPRIWLGDVKDARTLVGNDHWALICVLEKEVSWFGFDPDEFKKRMPILSPDSNGEMRTTPKRLNMIAKAIDKALETHTNVLVFCGAGMERSPLALTWYIHRRKGVPLDTAYREVQIKRLEAVYRLHWIKDN